MIGCRKHQWNKKKKKKKKKKKHNFCIQIARLSKSIQDKDKQTTEEYDHKKFEIERDEIYHTFKSIEPVFQKNILISH